MARLRYLFPLLHTTIRSYFIVCILLYLLQMCLFHLLVHLFVSALTHQPPKTMMKASLVLLNFFLTVRTNISSPPSKGRRLIQPGMVQTIVDQPQSTAQVDTAYQADPQRRNHISVLHEMAQIIVDHAQSFVSSNDPLSGALFFLHQNTPLLHTPFSTPVDSIPEALKYYRTLSNTLTETILSGPVELTYTHLLSSEPHRSTSSAKIGVFSHLPVWQSVCLRGGAPD
ncbi:MAG: hypothetical protein J3R72DRAFT_435439 [Linnemannia gamsii]|nr:MAG: hypothetical protein J3R72DRAFT_435439 [Linnemannia gamsii]